MFVDEENIPLIQEDDYDDYNIPNTSRIDTRHRLWYPIPQWQHQTYH